MIEKFFNLFERLVVAIELLANIAAGRGPNAAPVVVEMFAWNSKIAHGRSALWASSCWFGCMGR